MPGSTVAALMSITWAPGGICTPAPTSAIRSPRTRISWLTSSLPERASNIRPARTATTWSRGARSFFDSGDADGVLPEGGPAPSPSCERAVGAVDTAIEATSAATTFTRASMFSSFVGALTIALNFVIVRVGGGPVEFRKIPSLAFSLVAQLASAGAIAQGYPARPVHIIAPFPAGGGYDFLARLLGSEMTKTFGQPVIIENKAGANGNIGTDAAAKSAPDGYTLLMGGNSPLSLNVGLYPKLPYDPVRDFEPISRVATQPNLFAAHPRLLVKSVAELV